MNKTSKLTLVMMVFIVLTVVPAAVYAFNAPTTGSFAYDVYDIAVDKILKGPIGFVAGVAAMVFGAASAIRGQLMTSVLPIIGGAVLLKADAIVKTLGLTI